MILFGALRHELIHFGKSRFIVLEQEVAQTLVISCFMDIKRAETHIGEVSLATTLRLGVSIVSFVLLFLFSLDGFFKIRYGFFVLTNVEVHDSTVEVEILLFEDPFLIVAIRFDLMSLFF